MAQIDIYGFIGDDWGGGVTLKSVADQLNAITDDKITVNISSGGGYVNEGKAIYNLLKNSGKDITVNIIGQAYSIASVIAMAGNKIYIAEFADMMLHPAWTFTEGNADQLREIADQLDEISNELFEIYMTRAENKRSEIREYFDKETVIKAQECIELGLVDGMMSAQATMRRLPIYKAVAYYDKPKQTDMNITKDEAKGLFDELKNWVKNLIHPVKNASTTTTDGTTMYYDGALAVGTKVFSDEAMTEPTPDGTYTTDDNTVTVAGGEVTAIDAIQDSANSELESANARIAELESQLAEANNKTTDLESKLNSATEQFAAKITELESKVLGEGGNPDNHKHVPPAPVKHETVAEKMKRLEAENRKKYHTVN